MKNNKDIDNGVPRESKRTKVWNGVGVPSPEEKERIIRGFSRAIKAAFKKSGLGVPKEDRITSDTEEAKK